MTLKIEPTRFREVLGYIPFINKQSVSGSVQMTGNNNHQGKSQPDYFVTSGFTTPSVPLGF
jgi:hypothetical protein